MKKNILYFVILILLLSFTSTAIAVPENVSSGQRTFNIGGVNKTVNVVTIDLNSSHMELEVVTANDKVNGAEDFQSMINRKNPIAAINANFFDAYNSLEPYGSIMKNKKLTYLEGENTSFMITGKNKVSIDYFKTTIQGYLNGQKTNNWNNTTQKMDFNLFSIWYVNNLPTDSTGVYLYTPDRGQAITLNGGTAIEVIGNKITKTTKNAVQSSIPINGYIIYYGKDAVNDQYISDRFSTGKSVDFYHESTLSFDTDNIIKNAVSGNQAALATKVDSNVTAEGMGINLNAVDHMISAGPFLVNNGVVITDYISQGLKEAKIITGSAQRSALGITKDNKLILVTGSNLKMTELAEIMKNLNCDRAMNLDGGASSGLYAKSKMITTPGRKLNTVLMIHDRVK